MIGVLFVSVKVGILNLFTKFDSKLHILEFSSRSTSWCMNQTESQRKLENNGKVECTIIGCSV